jgi:hypothetical protein
VVDEVDRSKLGIGERGASELDRIASGYRAARLTHANLWMSQEQRGRE